MTLQNSKPFEWIPKSSNCDMLWNESNTKNFNGEITMTIRVFLRKTWVHPFHTKIKVEIGVDRCHHVESSLSRLVLVGSQKVPSIESKVTPKNALFFSAGYLNNPRGLASVNCPTLSYFFTKFHYETYFCRLALQKHLNFTVSLRSRVTWKKVFWNKNHLPKKTKFSPSHFFSERIHIFRCFFQDFLGPPFFFW